ncbi:MAG: right-handed parallel beta-helix repeat-containing protein, partial [Phycisphaerae bacterium]|nr:right-handed parallel beta-helix repeat-containing protein [Phycisphaerae bacterium]
MSNVKTSKVLAGSVCALFLFGIGVNAALAGTTYYVSLTGNNSWNGLTPQTAFRTIVKGVSVITAGDTLIIKSGNYGNEQVTLYRSGAAGSPITIKAEEPGKVIMKGTGGDRGIYLRNRSYIIIEGIEFTNYSSGIGIWYSSSYITVRKCLFRENNSSGITVYGRFTNPGASQHILLTENTFLDFTDKQDYGLCLYASTNLKATNNYFYGKHHQALSFKKLMKDSV